MSMWRMLSSPWLINSLSEAESRNLKAKRQQRRYQVTQESATERPTFHNAYDQTFEGSMGHYDWGASLLLPRIGLCFWLWWPRFLISSHCQDVILLYQDQSHGMERIEVRSAQAMPIRYMSSQMDQDQGGSSLLYQFGLFAAFIPKNGAEGYGYLLNTLDKLGSFSQIEKRSLW